MTEYIKEIFEGNIDGLTSYDRWLNEREQFELGLLYTNFFLNCNNFLFHLIKHNIDMKE